MATPRSYIDQLRLHVDGNHAQRLNYVHDQQRIMRASGATQAFKVSAETRRILDVANGNQPGSSINQPYQLFQIDSTFSLFTHSHFDTQPVSNPQPGINVGRKFVAESYEVIARAPVEAIRDCRETVRSVAHECDLLRTCTEHAGDKLPRAFLNCDPFAKVYRSVF